MNSIFCNTNACLNILNVVSVSLVPLRATLQNLANIDNKLLETA